MVPLFCGACALRALLRGECSHSPRLAHINVRSLKSLKRRYQNGYHTQFATGIVEANTGLQGEIPCQQLGAYQEPETPESKDTPYLHQ